MESNIVRSKIRPLEGSLIDCDLIVSPELVDMAFFGGEREEMDYSFGLTLVSEVENYLRRLDSNYSFDHGPNHSRIVFAGELNEGFRVISSGDRIVDGVFSRVNVGDIEDYTGENLNGNFRHKYPTLVVAKSDFVASCVGNMFKELGYEPIRVDLD